MRTTQFALPSQEVSTQGGPVARRDVETYLSSYDWQYIGAPLPHS